jgi:hypothetical protein
MIALLLVLASSSPLDPLWALVDEERYDSAISGALQIARQTGNTEKLRQNALNLALNAACAGQAQRCDEVARLAADWNPLWRPDSRAQPALVQAVGRARLSRSSRHSRRPKGTLSAARWCGPATTVELLLVADNAGISERKRETGVCVELAGANSGYLIAYDRQLRPVAMLGSADAAVDLRVKTAGGNQTLTIGALVAGAVLAGAVGYLLLSDPGSGELQLTIEQRP